MGYVLSPIWRKSTIFIYFFILKTAHIIIIIINIINIMQLFVNDTFLKKSTY